MPTRKHKHTSKTKRKSAHGRYHTRIERMKRKSRLFWLRLIRDKHQPEKVAAGFAIGMFVAITPTIPFQMVLSIFFATLFRVNRLVGIIAVWITNPITAPFVYYFNYVLGRYMLGYPGGLTLERVKIFVAKARLTFDIDHWVAFVRVGTELGADILIPLIFGSLFVAVIASLLSYFTALPICRWVSANRPHLLRSALHGIRSRTKEIRKRLK